ncbi:hypothetical protein U1Q18_001792, partial [Sarracenia purpurea var. burkii]
LSSFDRTGSTSSDHHLNFLTVIGGRKVSTYSFRIESESPPNGQHFTTSTVRILEVYSLQHQDTSQRSTNMGTQKR